MVLSICSERGSTGHRGWSRIREEVERREYTAGGRAGGDYFPLNALSIVAVRQSSDPSKRTSPEGTNRSPVLPPSASSTSRVSPKITPEMAGEVAKTALLGRMVS